MTTTPPSVDVVVTIGTSASNHAPTSTFAASATTIAVGTPVTFQASATDPDGDELAYFWRFDGEINAAADRTMLPWFASGPKTSATWTTAREVVIQSVVSDMKGGKSSSSMILTVGTRATDRFRVSGHVTHAGAPLAGALVVLDLSGSPWQSVVTDSDGSFTLVNVPNTTAASLHAHMEGVYTITPSFTNPVTINHDTAGLDFIATPFAFDLLDTVK